MFIPNTPNTTAPNSEHNRYFTHKDIYGIVVPIITPLTDDFQIDKPAVKRLVNHIIGNKSERSEQSEPYIHALFVNGLTGEFPWLDARVQKSMLEATLEECNSRVPVLFGASGDTVDETLKLCRFGKDAGADALVIAPLYFHPTNVGLPDVVKIIADTAELPFYLYNNPYFSVLKQGHEENIMPDSLSTIVCITSNVNGAKDSSKHGAFVDEYRSAANTAHTANRANTAHTTRTADASSAADRAESIGAESRADINDNFRTFVGDESQIYRIPDCVPSIANFDPEKCRHLYNEVVAGRNEISKELQDEICETGRIIYCDYRKIRSGLKYALSVIGICTDVTAEPNQQLTMMEKKGINQMLATA